MGLDNLEDFLKRKKEMEQTEKVSVGQVKKEWLKQIDDFYNQIKRYLTGLEKKKLLSFHIEKVKIEEEDLGEYVTNKMNILFPDQKLTIQPVGRYIIGAMGRIDLIGPNGTVKFLLVEKESSRPRFVSNIHLSSEVTKEKEVIKEREYVWKIATPPPNIQYISLNEDSFSECLLGVVRK